MIYRTARDPHNNQFEWRVANGIREVRFESGTWWRECEWPMRIYTHTPERIAMWAELVLNPTL